MDEFGVGSILSSPLITFFNKLLKFSYYENLLKDIFYFWSMVKILLKFILELKISFGKRIID